jgi:hypothetical protein
MCRCHAKGRNDGLWMRGAGAVQMQMPHALRKSLARSERARERSPQPASPSEQPEVLCSALAVLQGIALWRGALFQCCAALRGGTWRLDRSARKVARRTKLQPMMERARSVPTREPCELFAMPPFGSCEARSLLSVRCWRLVRQRCAGARPPSLEEDHNGCAAWRSAARLSAIGLATKCPHRG